MVLLLLLLEPRGQELRGGRRAGPRVPLHRLLRLARGEDVGPPSPVLLVVLGGSGCRKVVAAGGGQDGGALPRVRRLGILLVLDKRVGRLVEVSVISATYWMHK